PGLPSFSLPRDHDAHRTGLFLALPEREPSPRGRTGRISGRAPHIRKDRVVNERGYIIPVGGAEEKIGDVAILRRFASLCGAGTARIAIIPTASELDDTGERYVTLF